MNEAQINKILSDLKSGYDQMAEKFSGTRNFFWPDLAFIADMVKPGDRVFDFGCGNGRLLDILKEKNIIYIGADVSKHLIDLARSRYAENAGDFVMLPSGQSRLPFSDDFFNKIFSIAVFHHFPPDYARDMAGELFRITKTGGKVVISVWNLWQWRIWKKVLNAKFIKDKLFRRGEYADLGWRDIYIPFKDNHGVVFERFHHAYSERELNEIFSSCGFIVEKNMGGNKKNIILILKKPDVNEASSREVLHE